MASPLPGGDQFIEPNPYNWWSSWSPRDYWVPEPKVIPPAPPFNKWVPPPDQIAFGELPRDTARYQPLQRNVTGGAPVVVPPKPVSTAPQHNARPDWSLKDYSANQNNLSALTIPKLPPLTGPVLPQQNARPDWTLRDYNANQDRFSWMFPTSPSIWVPIGEQFAFGELPRDTTALQLTLLTRVLAQSPPSARPPLTTLIPVIQPVVRDLTAEKWVIESAKGTYLAIPIVPSAEVLMAFEYEPPDMTPYTVLTRTLSIPPNRTPQIPPAAIPYIPPPPWTLAQYQANQDRFSALATPSRPVYPPGLRPTFTLEALIREIPRATPLFQNFVLPKVPPFQFAQAVPYVQPPGWTLAQYQSLQDQFSALASGLPIPTGFRVMCVTAGWYNQVYYQPGDVFDLNTGLDFSDASFNYGTLSGTTQFGWMTQVPPGTALLVQREVQPIPLFPVIDPVPPKRFVY